jgi:hypothetical protein
MTNSKKTHFAHEQKRVPIQHRTSFTSFCLGPFGSEQNPPRICDGMELLLLHSIRFILPLLASAVRRQCDTTSHSDYNRIRALRL